MSFSFSLPLRLDLTNFKKNPQEMVDFVIAIEKEMRSMDFSEPLYKYLKSVMEKEDPAGL